MEPDSWSLGVPSQASLSQPAGVGFTFLYNCRIQGAIHGVGLIFFLGPHYALLSLEIELWPP